MIQGSLELRRRLEESLRTALICASFSLGIVPALVWAGAPFWLRFVLPVVSFALALALPNLLLGTPTYKLVWTVRNSPVLDSCNVTLVPAPTGSGLWEAPIEAELLTETRSISAEWRLRRLLKKKAVVLVEVTPAGAVDIRADLPTRGGANCAKTDVETGNGGLVTHRYLQLPITNAQKPKLNQEVSQSKLSFAVVVDDPKCSNTLSFATTLELASKGQRKERRIVAVGDSQRIKLEGRDGNSLK